VLLAPKVLAQKAERQVIEHVRALKARQMGSGGDGGMAAVGDLPRESLVAPADQPARRPGWAAGGY
jgi:hypothetical protein